MEVFPKQLTEPCKNHALLLFFQIMIRPDGEPQPVLERYRGPVDSYIAQTLSTDAHPDRLTGMVRYHHGLVDVQGRPLSNVDTGKAIRPTLVSLTVDALGGNPQHAVPAAAAVELVHNATLIHDDYMDRDTTRRGRRTVWDVYGGDQAINAGDAALMIGARTILDLTPPYPAETTLQAARILSATTVDIMRGQERDVAFESESKVSSEQYRSMVRLKTGVLLETSIGIGALLGGADEETTDQLRRYGESMGQLFQYQDDYLGIWGNPERTGKPIGSDIRRRKKSLPIVLAMDTATGASADVLSDVYANNDAPLGDEGTQRVLNVLDDLGIQDTTRTIIDAAHQQAYATIDTVPLRRHKQDFVTLADVFAHREK